MRRAFLLAFLAATLPWPITARADEFSRTMHDWRHRQHAVDAMIAGQTQYDQALLARYITSYIADAGRLAGGISPGSADALDLQRRFADFAATGQQALGDISQPGALQTDFSQLKAQCDSCHAIYNN